MTGGHRPAATAALSAGRPRERSNRRSSRFFPPLVMGLVYRATGDYSLGFVLLAITAAAAGALATTVVRRRVVRAGAG